MDDFTVGANDIVGAIAGVESEFTFSRNLLALVFVHVVAVGDVWLAIEHTVVMNLKRATVDEGDSSVTVVPEISDHFPLK